MQNFKPEDWHKSRERESILNSTKPDYNFVDETDNHSIGNHNIFDTLSLASFNSKKALENWKICVKRSETLITATCGLVQRMVN